METKKERLTSEEFKVLYRLYRKNSLDVRYAMKVFAIEERGLKRMSRKLMRVIFS